ncbi:enoyl-ACP reductase [Rhodococcus rhodnii]|uniref:Enoyl-ACP reductase n=2 Tax=Rhodococcus rhodnii TaxID=38312 RepID=A0A6P2CHM9_9NOCA|nr:saccharopine dehydrogenase NADP-binding domain-containing protein [Rhodococcus rhodnii]EOM78424.1 putative saccharopine dehydrogenase/reductase [Rhodococcus rhodnii LMG 5362]TXG91241.1 enoyl-ACP reductase [Rhodococcus rhodnii]
MSEHNDNTVTSTPVASGGGQREPGSTPREFDIVVYGASGFVGTLLAEYLAANAPEGVTIALGGRSREKLERVRDGLGDRAAQWPIVVADSFDRDALDSLAARTRVVATTVGPYARFGRELAGACADAGTDYVDLTGEVLFARESIDDNHKRAESTGARIVHSCGFDSVPSDLAVHLLHGAASADEQGELTDTTMLVSSLRGGISGGTIDSLRTQVVEGASDRTARRLMLDPYALSPERAREPDLGRELDMQIARGDAIGPGVQGTAAPFVMASYNTRVVRRSNALLDWAYGREFRYREVMSVGSSRWLSPVLAGVVSAGLGGLVAGLAARPTRALLDRVLPSPGDGPSEKTRQRGRFTIDTYTVTTTGARYVARFGAQGDPGYQATAVMLGESALGLALDRDALPAVAGVLTPATALGDVLVERLRARGFDISVRRL